MTKGLAALQGSKAAKRFMLVLLEALSGACSTTEAAKRLEISSARYYQLELRALQGMMSALEPRCRGRQNTPERMILMLEKEKRDLALELRRAQNLLRAARRTVGIKASKKRAGTKKKRRRKKPRARVVLETLRAKEVGDGSTQPDRTPHSGA